MCSDETMNKGLSSSVGNVEEQHLLGSSLHYAKYPHTFQYSPSLLYLLLAPNFDLSISTVFSKPSSLIPAFRTNNTCRNGNWVLHVISRNRRWRSNVNLLFSYRNQSFRSKTFPFSLIKVHLAFQQFNKAQMSHRHTTNALPTYLVRYEIKQLPTCRPAFDRHSTDS